MVEVQLCDASDEENLLLIYSINVAKSLRFHHSRLISFLNPSDSVVGDALKQANIRASFGFEVAAFEHDRLNLRDGG